MINNTCIYGLVTDGTNPVTDTIVGMTYISYNFDTIIEKLYDNTTGAYQFNLGDSDLLTLSKASLKNDVVILTNEDTYSTKLVLTSEVYQEFDIVDDGTLVVDAEEAAGVDESTNVVVMAIILQEYGQSLYNYYSVVVGEELRYETNDAELEYLPVELGEHIVTQKAVNETSGVISEVVHTIDVLQAEIRVGSIDYTFYAKKKKVIRVELPQTVRDTLVLETGWYYEGDKLIGKTQSLHEVRMSYYNGEVIIKSHIGDIIDY